MFQRGVVPRAKRKLIYTGIDIPSVNAGKPERNVSGPTHLPTVGELVPRLKYLPLDGVAVQILDFRFPNWPQTVVGNNLFGGFRYEAADLARAIDGLHELKNAPNLTDNFLPISTSYWFESGEKNPFDCLTKKMGHHAAQRGGLCQSCPCLANDKGLYFRHGMVQRNQTRRFAGLGIQHFQHEPFVQSGQQSRICPESANCLPRNYPQARH